MSAKDAKKQIEEMADVIERARLKARGVNGSMNEGFGMWYAKALWEVGYRRLETECPVQCKNCRFSRATTDAERLGFGIELMVCENKENSADDLRLVTPDHFCGHGERMKGGAHE